MKSKIKLIRRLSKGIEHEWLVPHDEIESEIELQIADSNYSAIQNARGRLSKIFSEATLDLLDSYFEAPNIHKYGNGTASVGKIEVLSILRELCSKTQGVVINQKAQGLQVGILGVSSRFDMNCLGTEIEPCSGLFMLSPNSLLNLARKNASVEIRQFDRQLNSWGGLADDLISISGADIFMKMFISGGTKSVNQWHRDTSDVLITILDGTKHFEVATLDSSEESHENEIDEILQCGDALILPRSRLHNATPTGRVSALLSIGLMRYGDWAYRGVSPSHLNLISPRSQQQYRLSLRSHLPELLTVKHEDSICRTRIPGGIGIVRKHGEKTILVSAGKTFETTKDIAMLLSIIHKAEGITASDIVREYHLPKSKCVEAINDLVSEGLVC